MFLSRALTGRPTKILAWALASWAWLSTASANAQDAPAAPVDAAQPPVAQTPVWNGTFGGGLALASGNTDALSYNFAVDVTYDTRSGNVFRWTGLYLRGTQNDILTVNRLALGMRDEYTFSPRVFVFGKVDYLQDTFKRIDYFIAPAVGLGYKLVDTTTSRLSIDLGAGSVTERDLGESPNTTAAVQAGESLQYQLNPNATIKHAIIGVWQANDFASALVTASVGISTRISERFQLSVDLLDTYKTRPPTTSTQRNDINLVVAITAKY